MIKWMLLWSIVVAGTLAGVVQAGADENSKTEAGANAGSAADAIFQRLKGLAGEWEAAKASDQVKKGQVVLTYRLTGGGTAVAETILPGTPMEMLSVYHRDGEQLVMTHYCCAGNQPRMRAKPGKNKDEVLFEFTGGSNLDPAKDGHIHGGMIRFVDANHLHSEWEFYVDGKPGRKHTFDLVKKNK
jgi:hypothetical protein